MLLCADRCCQVRRIRAGNSYPGSGCGTGGTQGLGTHSGGRGCVGVGEVKQRMARRVWSCNSGIIESANPCPCSLRRGRRHMPLLPPYAVNGHSKYFTTNSWAQAHHYATRPSQKTPKARYAYPKRDSNLGQHSHDSYAIASVNNMPAMLADVRVHKTPHTKAEMETFTTSPERLGEICESTPIWIPSEPMLPKPQQA
jgi:hypothetical protein